MSDGLKSGLACPKCGERVIGVFHEWSMLKDLAVFEYLHAMRDGGYRRRPCVDSMTVDEGFARMKAESADTPTLDVRE